MRFNRLLLAIGVLLTAITLNAKAELTSYTGAGGVSLVYSNLSDITWTQDGNLLGTLETTYGYSPTVNAIIAASPTIYDTTNPYDTPSMSGYHTVTSADFSSDGFTSWFGAQAFVTYLNSINYGGSNQWRLPTVIDTGNPGCDYPIECGFNVDTAASELAMLYYDELGKTAGQNTSGQYQNGYGIFSNNGSQVAGGAVGPFVNTQSYAYLSGTEVVGGGISPSVFYFITSSGDQSSVGKSGLLYAWAVSPGQVVAVPVPGAIWLFGTGLLGLLGLKRRGYAGLFGRLTPGVFWGYDMLWPVTSTYTYRFTAML